MPGMVYKKHPILRKFLQLLPKPGSKIERFRHLNLIFKARAVPNPSPATEKGATDKHRWTQMCEPARFCICVHRCLSVAKLLIRLASDDVAFVARSRIVALACCVLNLI
jgi:hypothetical protein